MTAYSPTGNKIVATLERIEARSNLVADSFDENGNFDYTGTTENLTQETVTDEDGERQFIDTEGDVWRECDLTLK